MSAFRLLPPSGRLRHPDHRFEWTRREFQDWAEGIAGRFGYSARFLPVGPVDEALGRRTRWGYFGERRQGVTDPSADDAGDGRENHQITGPEDTPSETASEGVWAVVANIKKEHPFGPGGLETKIGTRQFRGGTKVYIAGCFPGTCDAVVAIGLQRKSRRFITCAVDVRHVENFRVKLVYHPSVIERIRYDERCWIRTKEEAEIWSRAFPEWQVLWGKKAEE